MPAATVVIQGPACATVDVVGPLGTAFPLPKRKVSCLLVGGGYGTAPLFFLADELRNEGHRVDVILGARSAGLLLSHIEARRLASICRITTEDGTQGESGRVTDILERARTTVLDGRAGLSYGELVEVLQLPDDGIQDLLDLAHEVRMAHCGPDVEVEAIISLKTGGCPEDCHFCSQSGQFTSPVRSVWLDIPELVRAAKQTRETGASEFCIVAAVRGPDERLMTQMREGVAAIKAEVDIQVAASLGMLTQEQVDDLVDMGVHRYNHNLESARSYFPSVVTTHSFEERWETCEMVRESGMELCCGGLVGMGESLEQRAELAVQLAELDPHEVPLNFLNPRPGTPFGDLPLMESADALRTIAAFRLAMPRTVLRYAGGRELTLGDLGTREGLLGGINAVIVGNYLTTLGRPADADLDLLVELNMPIKELQKSL